MKTRSFFSNARYTGIPRNIRGVILAKEDFSSDDLDDILGVGSNKKPAKTNNKDFPNKLAILPILNKPFVPSMAVPLVIEVGLYFDLLKDISKMENKLIGLVLTRDKDQDIYDIGFDDIYEYGVVGRVLRILNVQESVGAHVVINIEKRFKILKPASKKKTKHLIAQVEYYEETIPKGKEDIITAYASNLITTIRELLTLNPIFREELQIVLSHSEFAQPYKLCDFAVALTTASREELQDILSTFDLVKRMEKALILLKKELDISKLTSMINQKIESSVQLSQREYILKEQLKLIKKELGLEKDDKTVDIDKFMERAEKLEFSEEAEKVFNEEIEKLGMLDVQSAEYSVVRTYLDWITALPWGVFDKENEVLSRAEAVLEEDHFGLTDVKERILEIMSVGHLNGTGTKASIICLVGPPGVGKTSIGRSIARALERAFYRLSVGGMRDEAEIKGHRRTYIGAMPGKLLQALKLTGVSNPIIMLDELDKISSSYQGDPASALLEVLDPEQNKEFLDQYLDIRFDLSNVLFIVTANTTDTIPAALLDRMEVIRLSGYIAQEKVQIGKTYLWPTARKKMGLTTKDVMLKPAALMHIITGYAREAGVRSLQKYIEKILRKIAKKKVLSIEEPAKGKKKTTFEKEIVTVEVVEKYLGLPIFTAENFYGNNIVSGVATGLAWTSMGGATLYIEAVMNAGKNPLKLTGNTAKVMEESSTIAFTYLMSEREKYLPDAMCFKDQEVHLHVPEGATPKDGPSAGITFTTAMISLCTGRSVPANIAMTGEITIKGFVLPIGGLKEKVIAAKRDNIDMIIFPYDNQRDLIELPSYLTKGIKFFPVKHYDEVHKIVWGEDRGDSKSGRKKATKKSTSKKDILGVPTKKKKAPRKRRSN